MGYIRRRSTTILKEMTLKLTQRIATALLCTLPLFLSAQHIGTAKQADRGTKLKRTVPFFKEARASLLPSTNRVISSFNFDTNGESAVRSKFQFVKGPLLEIMAKKELDGNLNSGKFMAYSNNTVEKIRRINTYDFVLQLNIGWAFLKNNIKN